MAASIVTMASNDEVAISPLSTEAGDLVAITNADNADREHQILSTVWATPFEARMLAARIVDVADSLDNIDDGTPAVSEADRVHAGAQANITALTTEIERLRSAIRLVRLQHTLDPEVHIDDIHRGLTPVYGDGCSECRTAWPCDTIRELDVAVPEVAS
jgi:hypothetical protein